MAWAPNDIGKPSPDAGAAREAVEAAQAEAKYRTDLIGVLREIRDALTGPNNPADLQDAGRDGTNTGTD